MWAIQQMPGSEIRPATPMQAASFNMEAVAGPRLRFSKGVSQEATVHSMAEAVCGSLMVGFVDHAISIRDNTPGCRAALGVEGLLLGRGAQSLANAHGVALSRHICEYQCDAPDKLRVQTC